ncbi:unnamed protein product [Nippostrongylus brasiliensis]|uniref:Uncharacterized protein n=1 Tax=Nippostrongylus brasiliensis TaxID=27835 RepID=A0A0N4XJH6_NIPBR|nr:unnamed protein product [Nippostrongylus brasiliensis]
MQLETPVPLFDIFRAQAEAKYGKEMLAIIECFTNSRCKCRESLETNGLVDRLRRHAMERTLQNRTITCAAHFLFTAALFPALKNIITDC